HVEVARILLEHGQDPNSKRKTGHTCLMLAAEQGNYDMVKLLLDNGAFTNSITDQYWNATFAAAYGGNLKVLELILN
ncbi:ankyrin repeat protein, partial [Zopfia rhizophila CBS 207.26]